VIIRDRLYGKFEVSEPVLLELVVSKPVQRLKKIEQLGLPYRYYPWSGFSRYEHSVGVMLLLRRFNASVEEQVAGLLHDVGHLAFSHLSDWIFGSLKDEESHEQISHKLIHGREIGSILSRYGLDPSRISDKERSTLLEQRAPDLCADRIDYVLRESWSNLGQNIAPKTLKNLIIPEDKFVFNSVESADLFAKSMLGLQRNHWGHPDAFRRYHLFADILRLAMKVGTISESDFYTHDEAILLKLEKSRDLNIKKGLSLLKLKRLPIPQSGRIIRKKFRFSDPLVLDRKGTLRRLSELDPSFKQFLTREKRHNKKGILVPSKYGF
jgi:HD superfamily phosphohydrolase